MPSPRLSRIDAFDWVLIVLAGVLVAYLAVQQVTDRNTPGQQGASAKTLERELAEQARTAFIEKIYAPVMELMKSGQYQEALLKLEELNNRYPGEAHGQILRGEILYRMGAPEEAAASFVAGIKTNGDYIDKHSPLSKRTVIKAFVDKYATQFSGQLKNSPDNPALKKTVNDFNYLRSRLAGGCE